MKVDSKVLVEFAHELHRVVEEFEEEMEILATKGIMDEIKKNEEAYEKGDIVEFSSIEELEDELGE